MPRFNRHGKKNGPRSKTKQGTRLVSWCPQCPRGEGMVGVSERQGKAVCKNGHVWNVVH